MPLEAAVVYFMIGTCYTELNNLNGALEAFNNAIKVNPDYAEVSMCNRQSSWYVCLPTGLLTSPVMFFFEVANFVLNLDRGKFSVRFHS